MKRQVLVMLSAALFVTGLAVTQAGAQTSKEIQAHVPFAFTVNGTYMPAGEYLVQVGPEGESLSVVSIESKDRLHCVVTMTDTGRLTADDSTPRLVFKRFGNAYFLAQVKADNGTPARVMPMGPAERHLARLEGDQAGNINRIG